MDRKNLLKQVIVTAGKKVLAIKPHKDIIQKEGRANFVTSADLASEKIIMDAIQQHFPTDTILSEEIESQIIDPLTVDHLWVLDPIDGTNNFYSDRAYCAISLGYAEKGMLQLGAVYDFNRNELFFAENGKGSTLNEKPIHVGNKQLLADTTIATDNSYDPNGTKRNIELLLKINPMPFVLMRGSAALIMCDIAAGRVDLYFHTSLKPWDNAAGFLLVEEAGGNITGLRGEDITFLSPEVVLGNSKLVTQTISFFT